MDDRTYQECELIKQGVANGKLDANLGLAWLRATVAEGQRRERGEQEPERRLDVHFYLRKLSVEQLDDLRLWADRIASRSGKLAGLIENWIREELAARDSLATDSPREPQRPNAIEAFDWSNAELANALLAWHAPSYSTSDPDIGQFWDALGVPLSCLVATRLTLSTYTRGT